MAQVNPSCSASCSVSLSRWKAKSEFDTIRNMSPRVDCAIIARPCSCTARSAEDRACGRRCDASNSALSRCSEYTVTWAAAALASSHESCSDSRSITRPSEINTSILGVWLSGRPSMSARRPSIDVRARARTSAATRFASDRTSFLHMRKSDPPAPRPPFATPHSRSIAAFMLASSPRSNASASVTPMFRVPKLATAVPSTFCNNCWTSA